MKKKIAVLACGWCDTFILEFLDGMRRATEGKDIDLYVFNAYNYTEYSGFPNYTGFSVFSLIKSRLLQSIKKWKVFPASV